MAWKKEYAGRYVNAANGWIAERSCDGDWLAINPETGKVSDRLPTLREIKRVYGN